MNFVYHYYIDNPAVFKGIQSPKELAARFSPSEKEWNNLVSFACKDSIELSAVPVKDKNVLLQRMQGLMARQIWRSEGYFELTNLRDSTIMQALKHF